jgi:hypothetical protein
MNTRNHLLQWYEVQDNKCSEIISYNGRAAAAQDSSQVFRMVILLGLAVLIRVMKLSLEEETRSCVFILFLH